MDQAQLEGLLERMADMTASKTETRLLAKFDARVREVALEAAQMCCNKLEEKMKSEMKILRRVLKEGTRSQTSTGGDSGSTNPYNPAGLYSRPAGSHEAVEFKGWVANWEIRTTRPFVKRKPKASLRQQLGI